MSQPEPINLFYSYSHRDEKFRDSLETHLSLLKRRKVINEWHDRRITAGTDWAGQISEHLEKADIILLLVSSDFIASDYCYEVEMMRAMERHKSGEARVIPIILRSCDWNFGVPFAKLQALPKDAKPITRWQDQDEAFTDVAKGIRLAAEQLSEIRLDREPPRQPARELSERKQCFVLMPFGEIFDVYYEKVYRRAIEDAGYKAVRADTLFGTGSLIEQVWREIGKSEVVLADLSGRNPNVYYELGLANSQFKPVILTASAHGDAPFDIAHARTFVYDVREPGWGEMLKQYVTEQLDRVNKDPSQFVIPFINVAKVSDSNVF